MDVRNDPIVALATPPAHSALAVLRAAGEGCIELFASICRNPARITGAAGHTIVHADLIDPRSGVPLDEVLVAVYRAPRSYSGDDAVEVFCHGNPAGITRILEVCYAQGFLPAEPGEFTLRAFMAGKLDLTRAEAVHEIVTAQTATAHEMALHRLGGSVESAVEAVKQEVVALMARIAVQIDYPDDEIGEVPLEVAPVRAARARIQELVATYETGRLYQEGVVVALGGRTNAGKSSLFNALVREERAIVSEVHGTTRDYIETRIALGGIPITLYDTAGLRTTAEAIEHEGIKRSERLLENAALVLYLVDAELGLQEEDRRNIERYRGDNRLLPLWTKVDLPKAAPAPEGFIPVSARTLAGFDELHAELVRRLAGERRYNPGAVIIDSLRQKDLLVRAGAALDHVIEGIESAMPIDAISLDVQEALNALGEITGEVTSADVLDTVFGTFCVGK